MIQANEFTGWVEKVLEPTMYGQEFTVRDYENDSDPSKPKYPCVLKFKCGAKIVSMLNNIVPGDKIRVKYFIYGRSGYGTKGYYCIVTLNVAKEGGITLLKSAPRPEEQKEGANAQQEELESEDIPF